MASITTDKNGNRRLQFKAPDGRRQTIRLGQVTKKVADQVRYHVEEIIAARTANVPLNASTAQWVTTLSDTMSERLAAAGLVKNQECVELGKFLKAYIESRTDVKQSTRDHLQRAADDLVDFFGEDRDIKTVTEADAEEFKRWLKHTRNLHENTASRRTGRARQFFTHAVKQKTIVANPFAGLKVTVHANEARFYFVPAEDVQKIIDKAPSAEWRLLIA
jgi:integrase-like protein